MFQRLKEVFSKGALSAKMKNGIVVSLCAAFVVSTCCSFAYASPNAVTIYDGENSPIQVRTTSASVGQVLSQQGIVLNEGDKINISLNESVARNTVIEIDRAMPVSIQYLGETRVFQTTKKMVSEILYEAGIAVDDNDIVTPRLTDTVEEGDTISVVVCDVQTITVQESIPFTTSERANDSMPQGERAVVQAGQVGTSETEYAITYQDGVEISRTVVSQIVLTEPVEEIVEYGTQDVFELGAIPASRPTNYTSVKTFHATAYDASPASNGPWAGQTSTGMPLQYGVVAVDPTVIPYGTRMYIESVDGAYVYGYAIAGDCGGAIKGNRVDLFYNTRSECYAFGRRDVNIYFLD